MQILPISLTRICSCKLNIKFTLVFILQGRVMAEYKASMYPEKLVAYFLAVLVPPLFHLTVKVQEKDFNFFIQKVYCKTI